MATKQERCSKRIEKIREKMAQEGMDALMLFSPINMFYYSGYYPHRPIYPTDVFQALSGDHPENRRTIPHHGQERRTNDQGRLVDPEAARL